MKKIFDIRLLALGVYLLIVFVCLIFHELWFDEVQAMRLSANVNSLIDLSFYLKNESHPPFYYWSLKLFSNLDHLFVLKTITFTSAAFVAYYLLFKLDISFWTAIFFCFSYYQLYEFGAISRSYGPSNVFLIALLFDLKDQKKREYSSFFLLLALSLMHFFSFIISILLSFFYFRKYHGGRFAKIITFAIVGVFSFFHLVPQEGTLYHPFWINGLSFSRLFEASFSLVRYLIPIPRYLNDNLEWGSNLADGTLFSLFLTIALMSLLLFSVRKSYKLMATYTIISVVFFILYYVKYSGAYRHQVYLGIIYFSLIYLMNIRLEKKIFYTLGIINVVIGVVFVFSDINGIFSAGKSAATYIKDNYQHVKLIYVDNPIYSLSTSFYSGLPLYALPVEKKTFAMSFARKTIKEGRIVENELGEKKSSHAYLMDNQDCKRSCLYLLNFKIKNLEAQKLGLQLVYAESKVMNKFERLYLYEFKN